DRRVPTPGAVATVCRPGDDGPVLQEGQRNASPPSMAGARRMLATMPIDLPLLPLGSWFPQGSWPQLPCGACATGALRVSRPTEIDASARYRDHPDWDPEWIRGY